MLRPICWAKRPGAVHGLVCLPEELETARAKGKLAGLLKRAFKADAVHVPDDIVERIRINLEKATLDRLGLEARASNLISGAEKVDQAARCWGGCAAAPCRRRQR